MNEIPKICLMCKHFEFDSGWGGTGVTPGDAVVIDCNKGHWNKFGMYAPVNFLRKEMAKAIDCDDYEVSEDALNIFNLSVGAWEDEFETPEFKTKDVTWPERMQYTAGDVPKLHKEG